MMKPEIYEAVAELGNFFRELCCKTLKLDVLDRLEKEIPIILCKLEQIFPPAFFTVMVHLCVHLPEEAKLRGPVQYGWMYPIERRLLKCKRSVRNMARPEGSIAEAYIVDECLTFCSRYFNDVETRFNRPGRNSARDDSHTGDVSVFNHGVKFFGACQYLEADGADYDKMVYYVLRSCSEVVPYIDLCKEELKEQDSRINVDRWLAKNFAKWFQDHIGKLHEEKKVSADLFVLACQPDRRVRVYSGCIVDGVRYHTVGREKFRNTQNSGILTEGDHEKEIIDFYGQLKSIVKLQYNSSGGFHRSVVLFRCDWFHVGGGKNPGLRDDGHFKSINTARLWYKNDPFILTSQATKVFYVPDTAYGGSWRVVQKFQHRHLWSVAETEEKGPGGVGLTYQDDEAPHVPVEEGNVQTRLRRDRERVLVHAAVVEKLKKTRQEPVDGHESEDDERNRTDPTMFQYCSDDDENRHGVPGFDDDE